MTKIVGWKKRIAAPKLSQKLRANILTTGSPSNAPDRWWQL
jgi:hypothetical protein